jgi:hypothetical protein
MVTTRTTNTFPKSLAQANNVSPHNVDSASTAPCPTFSVLHALSEEGNRGYRRNEDEDSYKEGMSYGDEQSENDTDVESTQKAEDAEQDFFFFCQREVERYQEAMKRYFN